MTPYEDAAREKDALYARIQLVKGELARERDPARQGEQRSRLRILREMYRESLDRLDALRPPQEKKRHKTVRRTVIRTDAFIGKNANSANFWEHCNEAFADLEGHQVRWDELGEDNSTDRARLLRALRRGRAAVSNRQREMLDLYLCGKNATEIAAELGVDKSSVSRVLQRAKTVIRKTEEDMRLEERREEPNRIDLSEPETARHVLSRLTEMQAVYLYLYYGEWLSMQGIGTLLGVNRSTVCRTLHRAAERIRALCTDSSGAELVGVDALEPVLYELCRQHAADELIPERTKAVEGHRRRLKETSEHTALSVPIWGQSRHRTAAQSRLLRVLEDTEAERADSLFDRLRAIFRALRERLGLKAA